MVRMGRMACAPTYPNGEKVPHESGLLSHVVLAPLADHRKNLGTCHSDAERGEAEESLYLLGFLGYEIASWNLPSIKIRGFFASHRSLRITGIGRRSEHPPKRSITGWNETTETDETNGTIL